MRAYRMTTRLPAVAAYERFIIKVEKTDTCWLWTAAKDAAGYGSFHDETRRRVGAHRWSYQHHVGPVPPGLHLDHLCRVKHCVNPAHLEPVTNQVNTIRGFQAIGSDEQCRNGHPRTDLYIAKDGSRVCRECKRVRDRRYYHAAKEAS